MEKEEKNFMYIIKKHCEKQIASMYLQGVLKQKGGVSSVLDGNATIPDEKWEDQDFVYEMLSKDGLLLSEFGPLARDSKLCEQVLTTKNLTAAVKSIQKLMHEDNESESKAAELADRCVKKIMSSLWFSRLSGFIGDNELEIGLDVFGNTGCTGIICYQRDLLWEKLGNYEAQYYRPEIQLPEGKKAEKKREEIRAKIKEIRDKILRIDLTLKVNNKQRF